MRISNEERKGIYWEHEFQLIKKRCPNGGKICYTTRKKALKSMQRCNTKAEKCKMKKRINAVYLCPNCDCWHTTKQNPHTRTER